MLRILLISSHVAYGSVGLTATAAPLFQAGFEVVALPTVVLSNHPGHPRFAGATLDPQTLAAMTGALDANGWLGGFDAIFSGYLPTEAHVAWVAAVVDRMRALNPGVLYFCDPVLGDDPGGLYIEAAAAEAVRGRLLRRCDVLTPNRFELAWLSGLEVRSPSAAAIAAQALRCPKVCATSIPSGASKLANVLVSGNGTLINEVEKLEQVPHGTGDLFAGLLAAELLEGAPDAAALGFATRGVAHALNVSRGSDRLLLPAIDWANFSSKPQI